MDPIETLNFEKDSTLAFLWEADARGWTIEYMLPSWIYLDNQRQKHPRVMAQVQRLKPLRDSGCWHRLDQPRALALTELDVLLLRQDPPFDLNYLYCTQLVELAEHQGLLVVNRPGSIRSANEKLFATQFPKLTPNTCVSSLFKPIQDFYRTHQDIIMKPLDGMGGCGIFRIGPKDPNLKVAFEQLSDNGKLPIMAQQFIPEIAEGDKRILMIDGQPLQYALARKPPEGQIRANLAAGGTGVGVALSEQDRKICEQVSPLLKKMGLMFVGLDVIGNFLTEINVTSPTCIRELDKQFDLNIAAILLDAIEKKLNP